MQQEKSLFGLIGFPLSHSFSKKYFSDKFKEEGLDDFQYELFELEDITMMDDLVRSPGLKGLNVTIPYKEQVQPYLTALDESAERVGAVNVIHFKSQKEIIGYNSDYYGFKNSMLAWLASDRPHVVIDQLKALVLGTGGASKAVIATLKSLNIPFQLISRSSSEGKLSYGELKENPSILQTHHLIINTTPLGMSPKVDTAPDLDYQALHQDHLLYDLVYNPVQSLFLKYGAEKGAATKNGLEMLHLQAEKSWDIWNEVSD